MNNYLWICSYGQVRSVTAARIFGGTFAGTCNRYDEGKMEELCGRAKKIFIFTELNREQFVNEYPQFEDKIAQVMEIEDDYGIVGHPDLVDKILKAVSLPDKWTYGTPLSYEDMCRAHKKDARKLRKESIGVEMAWNLCKSFGYCMTCPYNRERICKLFGDPYNDDDSCLWEK